MVVEGLAVAWQFFGGWRGGVEVYFDHTVCPPVLITWTPFGGALGSR